MATDASPWSLSSNERNCLFDHLCLPAFSGFFNFNRLFFFSSRVAVCHFSSFKHRLILYYNPLRLHTSFQIQSGLTSYLSAVTLSDVSRCRRIVRGAFISSAASPPEFKQEKNSRRLSIQKTRRSPSEVFNSGGGFSRSLNKTAARGRERLRARLTPGA